MYKSATTLFTTTLLVVCLIHLTTAASVGNVRSTRSALQKLTCRHQNEAKKKIWKTCVKPTQPQEIPSYKDAGLNLPVKLRDNALKAMEIPPNTFRCFAVQRYANIDENINSKCPSLCKLYNPKIKNNCTIEDLVNIDFLGSHGISVVKSPRYGCSNYTKSEVCIYSVSMPCKDSPISISQESSEIDIAEGDSLEIIDYKTHTLYKPITGNDKDTLKQHIKTSDFLLLFLSEKDSTQGAGFKLQFECPTPKDNVEETEDEEEEENNVEGSGF